MNFEAVAARPEPRPTASTPAPPKISCRNLDFFYGKFRRSRTSTSTSPSAASRRSSGRRVAASRRCCARSTGCIRSIRASGRPARSSSTARTSSIPGVDLNMLRAKVGMVFQKPTPFPMSIYDNIAFGVSLYENLSQRDMDERVEWALTKAAMWGEAKDKLKQSGMALSGGQQQRLCIARAVAVKPEVLLLDEPTLRARSRSRRRRSRSSSRSCKEDYTIAIVTHNMQQAARVSDYTGYMYLGELVEFGATDTIFLKPKRKETEDYITGRFG